METSLVITNKVGLHARPARLLVQTAAQFQSRISVQCGEKTANAKSILGVKELSMNPLSILNVKAALHAHPMEFWRECARGLFRTETAADVQDMLQSIK